MSFYRTLLAAVAAIVLAAPVFADDNTNTTGTDANQVTQASNDTQQTTGTEQNTTETKVNLNKATAKELMSVKGINATKARAIVAYRKKHGDFKSFDELTSVKGFKKMNPEMIKNIEDQLSIE